MACSGVRRNTRGELASRTIGLHDIWTLSLASGLRTSADRAAAVRHLELNPG